MRFTHFLFLLILLPIIIAAQSLKLYGEPTPGTIMIGQADNIKNVSLDDDPLLFDSNGTFVFGFDRDATSTHNLKLEYKNGLVEIKELKLNEREYEIQRINNMKSKYVTPPKSELPRIEREREMMKAARRKIGKDSDALFMSGFQRPIKGGRITGVFGSQRILNGTPKSPHNGYDIASPKGTPIYAAADGIVRIAGDNFYYNGNFALIDHGQGLSSVYLHMSKILVKDGQHVNKGEKIGEVGMTGRSTGNHLHWGVQWYNKRIDPLYLLNLDKELNAN